MQWSHPNEDKAGAVFTPKKPLKSPFRIVGLIVNSLYLFRSPVGPQIIDPLVEKDSWINTIKQLTL